MEFGLAPGAERAGRRSLISDFNTPDRADSATPRSLRRIPTGLDASISEISELRANRSAQHPESADWRRRALVKYLAARPRDYLLAGPGAGKTTFACASLRNC